MTRRAWCAMRSGTESRRRRFVNPEIPDPLTRPRPTLNTGLRCLGAVRRAVMLAARVAAGKEPMMETGSVSRSAESGALRARNAEALRRVRSVEALRARNTELAGQLRAAAMESDDAHMTRLLSELLRFHGLTKGQRVSLQLKALLNLVHSLPGVASCRSERGCSTSRPAMCAPRTWSTST